MKHAGVDVGICPDCGKIRHRSRRAGGRSRGTAGKSMHAYRCGDYWHLTSRSAAVIIAYRDWRAGQ